MKKKYIKIIKHLYKNLQKKDELKNEFEKTSNSIILYLFASMWIVFLILFSFIFGVEINDLFLTFIFSCLSVNFLTLFILLFDIHILNNLVTKKLSKNNLFNLYGRNYNFNTFLFKILEEIIKNNEKENLKPYRKEITHIINSISDKTKQNNIKIQFLEKMEIDVDSQLINLTEHKSEEENIIQIENKYIVVNN